MQRMEAPTRCSLGSTTQPSLQSSHFFARPEAGGVVRSARGGHSLALTCSGDIIAAGALRSARVVLRGHRHDCGPLGLSLRDARFRLRLIRNASPRLGLRRRASRVPHLSLHACCAPYPAGAIDALRCSRRWCCLRRDMISPSARGLLPGAPTLAGRDLHPLGKRSEQTDAQRLGFGLRHDAPSSKDSARR
jgi:hypothetical protein